MVPGPSQWFCHFGEEIVLAWTHIEGVRWMFQNLQLPAALEVRDSNSGATKLKVHRCCTPVNTAMSEISYSFHYVSSNPCIFSQWCMAIYTEWFMKNIIHSFIHSFIQGIDLSCHADEKNVIWIWVRFFILQEMWGLQYLKLNYEKLK